MNGVQLQCVLRNGYSSTVMFRSNTSLSEMYRRKHFGIRNHTNTVHIHSCPNNRHPQMSAEDWYQVLAAEVSAMYSMTSHRLKMDWNVWIVTKNTSIMRFQIIPSSYNVPSVLWCCWLGGRKGIRPVKNWAVGCGRGYLSAARCRLAYGPADATATHCLLLQ